MEKSMGNPISTCNISNVPVTIKNNHTVLCLCCQNLSIAKKETVQMNTNCVKVPEKQRNLKTVDWSLDLLNSNFECKQQKLGR